MMAASFVSGVSDAIITSGETSYSSSTGTTTSLNDELSNPDIFLVGLGQVGDDFVEYLSKYSDIDPTVTLAAGKGIGILLTGDINLIKGGDEYGGQ